jgi:hypothetical protein
MSMEIERGGQARKGEDRSDIGRIVSYIFTYYGTRT